LQTCPSQNKGQKKENITQEKKSVNLTDRPVSETLGQRSNGKSGSVENRLSKTTHEKDD